jgi:site-specific recombinase XerD
VRTLSRIESGEAGGDSIGELGLEGVAAPPEGQPSSGALRGRSRPGRRSRVRLEDAITWFLSEWPHEGPHPPTADTVRTYSGSLRWFIHFAESIGRPRLEEALQPQTVREAFKAQMDQARHRSASYKGGEASAAGVAHATRRLARWLLAQGVPVANLSTVKPPKAPERIQPRLLPDEFRALEAAALREIVDRDHINPQAMLARNLALLYMLYDTGLRCKEVVGMNVDDIDFDRGCVLVRDGKFRKQRALSIRDAADPHGGRTLRLLADWIRCRQGVRHTDEHERLWVSIPHGRPLSRASIRRVLRELCIAAGLDENRPPHAFRRANFTEHYASDPRQLRLLAARMGWSESSHHMISVYTRGAEIEIAATQELPSLAGRRRPDNANSYPEVTGPNVRSFGRPYRPILSSGVSPGVGEATARPRRPYTGDGTRAGSVSPRRGSRHEQ